MRKFYYCKNCGYVSDIKEYCGACQDNHQIYFGNFIDIDMAYGYYQKRILKSPVNHNVK